MVQKIARRWTCVSLLGMVVLAGCGTSSNSNSGSASGSSNSIAPALRQYTKNATALPVSTPLKRSPAKGKTLVFLQCDVSQCKLFRDGAAAAAQAIGWQLRTIPYQNANPSTLVAAMNQALTYKPVAVAFSGLPEGDWQSMIPKYKAAGVALLPFSVGNVSLGPAVPVNISGAQDFAKAGGVMAKWIISDSKAHGHALVVDFPAYPVMHAYATAATDTLQQRCSGCKVTSLQVSLAQVANGSVLSSIVSALRRDPSIKYLVSSEGALTQGIQSSLKGAGLRDVKVCGGSPTVLDLQSLRSGTPGAWTAQPLHYMGWQVVDAAARLSEKMRIPPNDGGWPQHLVTSSNIPQNLNSAVEQPLNYPARFKKLWKVG